MQLPLDFDADNVRERVEACSGTWKHYRINPTVVVDVIRHPGKYWREVPIDKDIPANMPLGIMKVRTCWSPTDPLREIQWAILCSLTGSIVLEHRFPQTAFGKGDNVLKNASFHCHNNSSLMLDIKSAFESIKKKQLRAFLRRECCCTREWAWVFAQLLTFRRRLRQGAPVAPWIFNAMMHRLDMDLIAALGAPNQGHYSTRNEPGYEAVLTHREGPRVRPYQGGPVYTRYADNLCVSAESDEPGLRFPGELKEKIYDVIERHHIKLNTAKTLEGHDGRLFFPGTEIYQGRVVPNPAYRESLRIGYSSGELGSRQIQGHIAYVSQYGEPGDWVLQKIGILERKER
jgi:hypothetical protein